MLQQRRGISNFTQCLDGVRWGRGEWKVTGMYYILVYSGHLPLYSPSIQNIPLMCASMNCV